MSKGELLKANATTWSKSTCNKMSATAITDGKVQHANATTWFDNYPMEQLHQQYFNVVWTQAYNGSGTKLDPATWGDHPRSGDSINFHGLFGFDRAAMQSFVAGGEVVKVQILVQFNDPSHAGNPTVHFAPHVYTSKPASYDGINANFNYMTSSQFNQTGADYNRWIELPVGAWLSGNMGGIVIRGAAPSAGNSAIFSGKTTSHGITWFSSLINLEVIK